MTTAEKLSRLQEWRHHLLMLESAWDKLESAVGADHDSPLGNAVWLAFDAYTQAIGREIGDVGGWMSWHWLENKLGARGHEAGNRHVMRPIKTLDDLLWVIDLEDSAV